MHVGEAINQTVNTGYREGNNIREVRTWMMGEVKFLSYLLP
jgi:hypothetical protein